MRNYTFSTKTKRIPARQILDTLEALPEDQWTKAVYCRSDLKQGCLRYCMLGWLHETLDLSPYRFPVSFHRTVARINDRSETLEEAKQKARMFLENRHYITYEE